MSTTITGESQKYGAFYRQPKNVNPLLPNKFTFFVTKLPEMSLAVQSVNIPGVNLPYWEQKEPFNPIPRSGLNLEFEPFSISFVVDRDLNGYFQIQNWMRMMSLMKDNTGYEAVEMEDLQPGPQGGLVSDAQIILLTNESVPNIVFYFRNAFPINCGGIDLTATDDNPQSIICTAKFAYDYYDFETVNSTVEPD